MGWTSDSLQALPLPPKPYSFTVLLQKDILWAVAQGQYVNSIVHRVNHNCKPRALEWKVVCRGPAQTTRRIFCRVSSCHQGRDILKRPLPSMSDWVALSETGSQYPNSCLCPFPHVPKEATIGVGMRGGTVFEIQPQVCQHPL